MTISSDEVAIHRTIAQYSEGMRTGDVETLRKAFYEVAILCKNLGEEIIVAPIEELYDRVDANGTASDYSCSVLGIEITGRLAAARIRERDLYSEVIDDLHLAKVSNRWRIISKISDVKPPSSAGN